MQPTRDSRDWGWGMMEPDGSITSYDNLPPWMNPAYQQSAAPAPAPAAPVPAPIQRPMPQPRQQIGMLGGGSGYNRQLENMLSMFLPMMQGRTTGMYGLNGLQMPQQPQADTFASRYQQGRPPVAPQSQPTLGFRGRYGG